MNAGETLKLPTREERGRARPFGALPAVLVVVLGTAVALAIALFGMAELRRSSDEAAAARAEVLARSLATVLRETEIQAAMQRPSHAAAATSSTSMLPDRDAWEASIAAFSQRTKGTETVLARTDGTLVIDRSVRALERDRVQEYLTQKHGVTEAGVGRARFYVVPVGRPGLKLIVFVRAPETPEEIPAFLGALTALALLLVLLASLSAYVMGQDATHDVAYVAERIAQMSQVASEPAGEPLAPRSLDAMGVLTMSFDELRHRFAEASARYRQDLTRAKGQDQDRAAFLAAVSHELRSPLNAVLGFADVLLSEVDGPLSDAQRQEVEQIREGGKRLIELINDILEFSALEGGQLKLNLTRVDVLALADEVVREARMLAADKPISVMLKPTEAVYAHADEKRVRQILWNLVGNAVKFTQKGQVEVAVYRKANAAVLSVSDTGPGISQEERGFIFEEYKQAKAERGRRRGSGLGLAITRRLARLHGGGVELESELGRGSTFRVTLPLAVERFSGRLPPIEASPSSVREGRLPITMLAPQSGPLPALSDGAAAGPASRPFGNSPPSASGQTAVNGAHGSGPHNNGRGGSRV